MRWQRGARAVVAVAGLSCAGALYVYSRRHTPAPPPPKPSIVVDEKATSQSGPGQLQRVRGDQLVGILKHGGFRSYADGRTVFDHVHTYSYDERGMEIEADTLETATTAPQADNPQEMHFTGHVKITTKDGLQLNTDTATYSEQTGIANIPAAVTFTKARLSGQGIGGTYDKTHDVLSILDQAVVNFAPDDQGAGALNATAKAMTLDRSQHTLHLDQNAHIVRTEETMAASDALMHLSDDEKVLQGIDLHGQASIVPAQPGGPSAPPEMHSNDMALGFYPTGQTLQHAALTGAPALTLADQTGQRRITAASTIDLLLAPDGKTLTRLEAHDRVVVTLPQTPQAPAREIKSTTLVSAGDEKKGLTGASFTGGVTFTEKPAPPAGQKPVVRTATSQTLDTILDGQLDAIKQADFRGTVIFSNGDVRADADTAAYHADSGHLELRPAKNSKRVPHVVDQDITVDAQFVDLDTNANDLKANGNVTTTSTQQEAAGSSAPSLFQPGKPVYGSSDALAYASAKGTATYTGAAGAQAVLRQQDSRVAADTITVENSTRNLNASGAVTSKFLIAPPPKAGEDGKPATPSPVQQYSMSGDTMKYVDDTRIATYAGKPAVMKSTDGTIEAAQLDLTLAKDSNTLEHLVADGTVFATLPGNREASGTHLVYEASTDAYTLTGTPARPARVKVPNTNRPDCAKSFGAKLVFPRGGGAVTGEENTVNVPCTESIR
jgi:lipopolysaccharide export system protein LptA